MNDFRSAPKPSWAPPQPPTTPNRTATPTHTHSFVSAHNHMHTTRPTTLPLKHTPQDWPHPSIGFGGGAQPTGGQRPTNQHALAEFKGSGFPRGRTSAKHHCRASSGVPHLDAPPGPGAPWPIRDGRGSGLVDSKMNKPCDARAVRRRLGELPSSFDFGRSEMSAPCWPCWARSLWIAGRRPLEYARHEPC